ncbi:NAD dependent epimerase/dehydratase family protein [Pseudoruegeria aquimaris]|uniref:NAD dependent epimerase/dehydratase family protein n=1 Tax=Pseudoruegeria aquimaris TaxID=393663 RepID=A0A1Y5SCC4_9RHOB|nr:NAD-dependent epimerase/dehydratase family protein [Pseudoruegeria aquimaris]SLN36378.1 NAD dependent epimerase/dehydratase family protein [Pseudoruegeria aquimaris]
MGGTVLVLGANGKIGRHACAAFWNAGWTVRRFDRARDDLVQAAQGCDVIVNGFNPPAYHDWANILPRLTADVIAAGQASGATVILPGNVYNFGDRPGVWSEDTPQRPCARKGEIRKRIEAEYRAAAAEGVQTLVLRAGDFIDPGRQETLMALVIMKDLAKGRLTTLGDPAVPRAYCYLPDWARAAVMLAAKRAELAPFEDVPFAGHAFSMLELQAEVARQLGRPVRLSRFPWWLMTLASPVWELAREMREMRYLFETPHRLSGAKLARLLPDFEPTPFSAAIAAEIPPEARRPSVDAAGQGQSMSTQTSA